MDEKNWLIRTAEPSDISFLYATWTNSYRYDSHLGKSCKNSVFFPSYAKVIDRILNLSDTEIDVACLPDNEDVIFGYIVYQPKVLHYIYVKEDFRKFGIAKDLFRHARGLVADPILVTHRTKSIDSYLNQHKELVYDPFLLFKQHGDNEHGTSNQ